MPSWSCPPLTQPLADAVGVDRQHLHAQRQVDRQMTPCGKLIDELVVLDVRAPNGPADLQRRAIARRREVAGKSPRVALRREVFLPRAVVHGLAPLCAPRLECLVGQDALQFLAAKTGLHAERVPES